MFEIRGPGHHERSELAATVTRVLSASGRRVWVRMDLRPRLAADITGVLEKGADRVLLSGDGLFGIASNEELIDELPADITIIELRATADRLGLYGDIDELSSAEVIALQSEGVVIDGVF